MDCKPQKMKLSDLFNQKRRKSLQLPSTAQKSTEIDKKIEAWITQKKKNAKLGEEKAQEASRLKLILKSQLKLETSEQLLEHSLGDNSYARRLKKEPFRKLTLFREHQAKYVKA